MSKYSLQFNPYMFSVFFLTVGHQDSHAYRIKGEIIILIVNCLASSFTPSVRSLGLEIQSLETQLPPQVLNYR